MGQALNRTPARPAFPPRRGFMVLDAIGGLVLVSILATILMVAINRTNRAQQRLADSRAALRIAERVLLELQTSGRHTVTDPDARISIQRLPDPAETPGLVWAEVSVGLGGQRVSLLGLAPVAAMPREGANP